MWTDNLTENCNLWVKVEMIQCYILCDVFCWDIHNCILTTLVCCYKSLLQIPVTNRRRQILEDRLYCLESSLNISKTSTLSQHMFAWNILRWNAIRLPSSRINTTEGWLLYIVVYCQVKRPPVILLHEQEPIRPHNCKKYVINKNQKCPISTWSIVREPIISNFYIVHLKREPIMSYFFMV